MDSGLASLAVTARFHGKAAEPQQLAHDLGLTGPARAEDLLRAAKRLELKATLGRLDVERAAKGTVPLPCIVELQPAGFAVLLFFFSAETNEYLISFTGTNGLDGHDWYNNLNYSTTQWSDENRDQVLIRIDDLASSNEEFADAHITFTGQSLGGALAQFAAYDYAKQRDALTEQDADQNLPLDRANLSLITFNGLGAIGGMEELRPYAGTGQAWYRRTTAPPEIPTSLAS